VSVLVENYTKEPFLGTIKRKENAYYETGEFVKYVQSAAGLEVVHSLLGTSPRFPLIHSDIRVGLKKKKDWEAGTNERVGLVRSPVSTTALQVLSRIVLVWGVCDNFPSVPANSLFYSSMLIAWSLTEVVRYGYFVFALNGYIPGILTWLRYNLFFVLYPLGISSEMALVYKSIPLAEKLDERYKWLGYGILGIYFPGKLAWFFGGGKKLEWSC
jgi:hypothetical protein